MAAPLRIGPLVPALYLLPRRRQAIRGSAPKAGIPLPDATLSEVASAILERIVPGCTIVISTGAGISRPSGIPTFRGAEGLWQTYRAEDVATIGVLERDPAHFWRFHDHLRTVIADAVPNPAHLVLAEMEAALASTSEFAVVTQNIDGLHQRAGSTRVIELHGNALQYHCMSCDAVPADVPIPAPEYPPHCRDCGGVLRPDVVLFGEALPEDAIGEAHDLALRADVMLVVGTSVVVQPAASLPFLALSAGALVVEVNPRPTSLTGMAGFSVQAPANTALPLLWQHLSEHIADA